MFTTSVEFVSVEKLSYDGVTFFSVITVAHQLLVNLYTHKYVIFVLSHHYYYHNLFVYASHWRINLKMLAW